VKRQKELKDHRAVIKKRLGQAGVQIINEKVNKKLALKALGAAKEDFFDLYTPDTSVVSKNFSEEGEEGKFETFGEDLKHVLRVHAKTPNRVWTLIDGDDGEILIINGLRRLNSIAYMITVENGHGESYSI
jgi:hypothetical protein